MRGPTKAELGAAVRWLKGDFAEWFIGSWALLIGWGIVSVIFFSFLQTDGFFSRGLGEGSGVDPNLFMYIGWMFRCFAATFLVLSVRFETAGLKATATKLKILGAFCTCIVILHAMGFGLKALDGKRAAAVAVVETHVVAAKSNDEIIAELNKQKDAIRADLEVRTKPIDAEIYSLDHDGKRNEDLGTAQKNRRSKLQDDAQSKIDKIDAAILTTTTTSGEAKTAAVTDTVKAEKWAPLFVGLAMLVTWSQHPSDFAIWLCGVGFLWAWVLLGDAIVIGVPPALYKLHMQDHAASVKGKAKAYDEWKAGLSEAGKKGAKKKDRNKRADAERLRIADLRSELAKREAVQAELDAEAAVDPNAPPPEPEPETDPTELEPVLEIIARANDPEEPPADEDDEDQEQSEAA